MSLWRNLLIGLGLAAAMLASASLVNAQGVQTGTVTGSISSTDGLPLPGVMVGATSAALQGARTAVTDVNGVYALRGLPAGTYTITLALSSFQPATRTGVDVSVGGTTEVDATMSLATRTETITVTAETPPSMAAVSTSQTYTKRQVDAMPVGRRPVDIAELAPGLTNTSFTAGQLIIGGAFGFDNVFMVNGVDTNDTIFGNQSPRNNLFIEDAIQETTVLTSGISAAYGRFSGGVVNVVTRSGGNVFSGSFRENLSNPQWINETPRERQNAITHIDVLNKTHEATFGGPIARDRLWFFSAGRYERTTAQNTFAQTGGTYLSKNTNKRGELKFTGAVAAGQTIQASYINNSTEEVNASGLAAASLVDASMLVTRQLPNRLFAANYNGALRSTLFATVQYSEKKQQFRNNGGTSTNIVNSPFRTLGAAVGVPGNLFYHAPYLDATDPEDRNNRQITGSLASLVSTSRFGTHDIKGGAEYFVSTGIGGNSQSSTGYVFVADYLVQAGRPVLDARGSPVPVFVPGATQVWNFLATRGASIDIRTTSLYAQDRWMVTPRLTVDLGARFEAVRGEATGDITTVDATSIVPRLGAAYDITGSGQTVLQATYSHYAGKYNQVQFSSNTNVGRPSEVDYVYTGPAGQGSDFAPGFDIGNYTQVVFASFPTANIQMADGIRSPIVREITLGIGRELGQNGYAKATYVRRTTSNFVDDFANRSTGTTTVPLVGTLTNRVLDNTDEPTREYQALLFQSSYRMGDALSIGGNYTVQLRNRGNFIGEAANQPAASSIFGDYPEIYGPALDRLLPEGRLDNYQQHKLRLYGTYTQIFGRFGSLDLSPIWRVNSAAVYSLSAAMTLTSVQLARNPGYPSNDVNPSVRQTVFFGERGQYDFKGYGVLDLAATYRIPVWKSAAPWLKAEIYNLLDNQKQIAWDRTVSVDRNSPLDANGIPTGYTQGPRFGQATSDNQFPQPYPGQNGGRAFRIALGVRF
ncbi:MAG: TonB-dependent receptor [Vicinamibacterales bacterium]